MISQWLHEWTFLGKPLSDYLTFLLVILGICAGYFVLMRILESRWLQRLAEDQKEFYQHLIDLARNPFKLVLATLVVWIGIQIFGVPKQFQDVSNKGLLALATITVSYVLFKLTDVLIAYLKPMAARTESRLDDQLLPLLGKTLKGFILVFTILLVLQNAGYNITTVLAGLGLFSLALALGAQQALSNIFGTIAILLDRPFQIGDTVRIGGVTGTVEEIRLRRTRIRTMEGTLVTFPNSMVANVEIDNVKAQPTRRTNFTIAVPYDTSYDKLQRAVKILRDVMGVHPGTAQYQAYFNSYGTSSLNILVHHWCKYLDYEPYLKCLEEINFEIKRRFEEESIEFAIPTQTVYVKDLTPDPSPSRRGVPKAG